MQTYTEPQFAPGQHQDPRVQLQPGVDKFMSGVFAWMSVGLLVSALVAFFISQSPATLNVLFGSGLKWVIMLAPIGFVWFFASKVHSMDRSTAIAMFLVYAALMGMSFSFIPIVYSAASIFTVFGITAVSFGCLSAFGYLTKRDMSGMGRFFFMGLIGLIVASIASMFIPGMSTGIAIFGVLLFAALTAYDTQKLRQIYLTRGGGGNLAIIGALELYLDFINIFLFLLRLFGDRD